VGVPLTALSLAIISVANATPTLVVMVVLWGVGQSLGVSGFNSAMSLAVGPQMQGEAAGLANSASTTPALVGPFAVTALYQVNPVLPYIGGTVMLVALSIFLSVYPAFRKASPPEN
jgi:MFS transporter, DHA1 family, tetracycline resistance protein